MEGNPRDPYLEHHQSIASVKAEKCKAFTIEGYDKFYFMDEEYNVSMFQRIDNKRILTKIKREFQRMVSSI